MVAISTLNVGDEIRWHVPRNCTHAFREQYDTYKVSEVLAVEGEYNHSILVKLNGYKLWITPELVREITRKAV